jgi:hypothetical protein
MARAPRSAAMRGFVLGALDSALDGFEAFLLDVPGRAGKLAASETVDTNFVSH